MIACVRTVLLAVALALGTLLATSGAAHAIEGCKVKVAAHDGALLVSAGNVAANPRWGFAAGEETMAFANAATCVVAGAARKCELGATGTPERITPPPLCTLYLADDGPTACAAYIKRCVPGVRDAAQGPPGPQGPQGPPGPPVQLRAYDATGAALGVVVSRPTGAVGVLNIFIEEIGKFAQLDAVPGRNCGCTLYFESDDCTGQPYMNTTDMNPYAACQPNGPISTSTVWVTSASTTEMKTLQSQGDGTSCYPTSATAAVYPVQPTALPFPLPVPTPITFGVGG